MFFFGGWGLVVGILDARMGQWKKNYKGPALRIIWIIWIIWIIAIILRLVHTSQTQITINQ